MTSDGRLLRGDRTRAAVALRAAELASLNGLESVSLGQIATDLLMSKSGVQAAFPTKQELQVAAVHAATDVFVDHVVRPALSKAEGLPRLKALIDNWLAYVGDRVLPGGCFLAATIPEFDSKPGPVRTALRRAKQHWLRTLADQVREAQKQGQLDTTVPPDLLAFEIDALLSMANTVCDLNDDRDALKSVRKLLKLRLTK